MSYYKHTLGVLACFFAVGSISAADLDRLLIYIPEQANSLMAIKLDALLSTPLARKENWKDQTKLSRLRFALPFPSDCRIVLVAAKKEAGSLKNEWALMLLDLKQPESMAAIASRAKTATTTLGDIPAVMLNEEAMVLGLADTLIGIYGPAHRQDAMRLIQRAKNRKEPVISPFLRDSATLSNEKTQIVVARDTNEAIDPLAARAFVNQLFSDKATEAERAAAAKAFASLSGVQFLISVDQDIRCTLKATFNQPLGDQGRKLPALVVTAMESTGLDLEPLSKAEAKLQEKSFTLDVRLSTEQLEHIISMMQVLPQSQAAAQATPEPATPATPAANDPSVLNRAYFDNVSKWAKEAHEAADRRNDYFRAIQLYENAARRIDHLPTKFIDPEVARFGLYVARHLRAIAAELQHAVNLVQALERTIVSNETLTPVMPLPGFYNPFRWGWTPAIMHGVFLPQQPQVQSNQQEVIAKQSQILSSAMRERNKLWNEILTETARARQHLDRTFPPPAPAK